MDVIWLVFLAAIGACVGSFLNVVGFPLELFEELLPQVWARWDALRVPARD